MNSLHYTSTQEELKREPKTWLVTGVAGFIGSNILETLLKLDQKVIGLDNFSNGRRENLAEIKTLVSREQWERFEMIEGDVTNRADCEKAVKGVRYVLHQAALGSVTRSLENPWNSHDSNVNGFFQMAIAARDAKVERFVFASSSSVYGDHPALPKLEDNIGKPLSPYAATKLINEIYGQVFFKSFELPAIGLRYFNVFGPRQNPESVYAAVIPTWCRALLKNESVFINGDGDTSRDFCYVKNAIQMNILAATTKNTKALGQIYNCSVGGRTTLKDLLTLIQERLQKEVPSFKKRDPIFRDFRKGDVRHSMADIAKATNELGYKPLYDIQSGLNEAIPWYVASYKSGAP